MERRDPLGPPGDWKERDRLWRRKLRRLRFDAEPLAEQVERIRLVTIVLTVVPSLMGLIVVVIFAAFGRVVVGLAVAGLILAPIVAMAWLDYRILSRRVSRYQQELAEFEGRQPLDLDGP